ncbi:hypothetical protein YC2023_095257 [Brassica napus]
MRATSSRKLGSPIIINKGLSRSSPPLIQGCSKKSHNDTVKGLQLYQRDCAAQILFLGSLLSVFHNKVMVGRSSDIPFLAAPSHSNGS